MTSPRPLWCRRPRGCERLTRLSLIFETWCSTLSTTRSRAASGSVAVACAFTQLLLEVDGHLALLARRDARVLHLDEVDLDAGGVGGEAGDLPDLLLRRLLELGGNGAVLASDQDLHHYLSRRTIEPRSIGNALLLLLSGARPSRTQGPRRRAPGGGVRADGGREHPPGAARPQGPGRGRERGAGGGDVVDHEHARAGRAHAGGTGARRAGAAAGRPVCAGPGVRASSPTRRSAEAPGERPGQQLRGIEAPVRRWSGWSAPR